MKKQISRTMLCVGIILVFIGTSIASGMNQKNISTDIQPSKLDIDEKAKIQNRKYTTDNGRINSLIATQTPSNIIGYNDQKILSKLKDLSRIAPDIINKENTFVIEMSYQFIKDSFVVSLDDFNWDKTNHLYTYELEEPYDFIYKDISLAKLLDLTIQFKMTPPYKIFY